MTFWWILVVHACLVTAQEALPGLVKRRHALSSLVVILVLKSCQSKGVLSGNAYEMMTRSRPETKTEQMLPASSGLFSPAGGTSQIHALW